MWRGEYLMPLTAHVSSLLSIISCLTDCLTDSRSRKQSDEVQKFSITKFYNSCNKIELPLEDMATNETKCRFVRMNNKWFHFIINLNLISCDLLVVEQSVERLPQRKHAAYVKQVRQQYGERDAFTEHPDSYRCQRLCSRRSNDCHMWAYKHSISV